jgi:hypothetical protein
MGVVAGVQRYLCHACGRSFRNTRKPSRRRSALWRDFLQNRSIVSQLAKDYGRSVHWIRKELRAYELPKPVIVPDKIVAIMDCVFFKRSSGYLVVRNAHNSSNVYWSEIESETINEYQCARNTLEGQGFSLKAIVIDGRPGVRKLFDDLPVQMCHFHQKAIITRYLTRRPKLEASKELREIVHVLCNTNEQMFTYAIDEWHEKWNEFLKERTVEPVTGRWHYTHKRLRSAYHSLRSNLPYLFTYQKYPELNIPNTTNSLDGSFAHLKGLIQVHRGLKIDLKRKLILSILQNRHRKK